MPDYRLSLEFSAADDRQAARLGMAWAATCAAEYGTRNPAVTPVDGELHDRIARHVRDTVRLRLGPRALEQAATGPITLSGTEADQIADAAMAVVTPRLCTALCADVERERDELAAAVERVRALATDATRLAGIGRDHADTAETPHQHIRDIIRHHAADAHRRKWALEHSPAFHELHRLATALTTALDTLPPAEQ